MLSPDFDFNSFKLPRSFTFYSLIYKTGTCKFIPKGKQIIRKGSNTRFFFYIKHGAFKTIVNASNKNYTLAFAFSDDIAFCPASLFHNLPNNFDMEAITDSEVLICEIDAFKNEAGAEVYSNIFNKLLYQYSAFLESQIIASLSLTAEERYHLLIKEQPDKLKEIPVTQVASFLGISIERLSRIRRKMKV